MDAKNLTIDIAAAVFDYAEYFTSQKGNKFFFIKYSKCYKTKCFTTKVKWSWITRVNIVDWFEIDYEFILFLILLRKKCLFERLDVLLIANKIIFISKIIFQRKKYIYIESNLRLRLTHLWHLNLMPVIILDAMKIQR